MELLLVSLELGRRKVLAGTNDGAASLPGWAETICSGVPSETNSGMPGNVRQPARVRVILRSRLFVTAAADEGKKGAADVCRKLRLMALSFPERV